MAESDAGVRASVGFRSEKGPRKRNEDFAAAVIGAELPEPRREVVAAIADGVGRRQGRPRRRGDRGARFSRRILGLAGDHGG